MFSHFFIERPIFAAVVSIIMVLAGLVALTVLPVQQYPTITPVQVTVSATYPGADSKTLADSVAAPIEAQINGVDNMLYMSSTSSSTGQLTLTVYFSLDTNPDIAQVQVQNRVNLALPQLPSAVTQQGVSVQKKSSSIMMLVAVFAKGGRYSSDYVANYANVYVLDALKRVNGAGQAQILGVPDQAMRIWMNPDRMASLGVTTSDIANAVSAQNALFGAGQIGQQPTAGPVELTFPVVTQGPFTDPRQYENIILRASQDGSAIVRVGDVARAEVGLRQYIVDSKLNNVPATFVAVYQQPGANGLIVSKAVRQTLEEMKARFPEGMDYVISLDTNDFVRLSIEEVIKTLGEAIVLVVLIVYLFLQSFRTTIICTVAIIVALTTTFAGMLALGFSVNLLTLFGLVLAIGMVVDDAIVVVENVERNMEQHHLAPKDATIKSMNEIGGSLVAVVLVMASVFVPAAFLPGTTGQLYKQFAITIVVSVSISGFVALTLTPAMCAIMLKHVPMRTTGFFGWFNRQVTRVTLAFGDAVTLVIKRMAIALVLMAVMLWGIYELFRILPSSFVPNEDQGYVMAAIIMPQSASLDRTQVIAQRVDAAFSKIPGVDKRAMITGYSLLDSGFKTNSGAFFVTLKDFKERYASIESAREQNARAVLTTLFKEVQSIEGAIVVPIAPPPIPGIGTTGGFEFWIQDTGTGDPTALDGVMQEFLPRQRQRPGAHGSRHHLSRQHAATARGCRPRQGDAAGRAGAGCLQRDPGAIRFADGEPIQPVQPRVVGDRAVRRAVPADAGRPDAPLYAFEPEPDGSAVDAGLDDSGSPDRICCRISMAFPPPRSTATPQPGYSSGQAIQAMEEVAKEVLPPGYTFAWSGLAYEEKKSGGTSALAFVFGLIIVFLVLAAQYESWTLPGAVMTAVPFGILGALADELDARPWKTTCTSRSAYWC